MSKLEQLKALREAKFGGGGESGPAEHQPADTTKYLKRASGRVEKPSTAGVAPGPPKFDRNAYQREYMRKWRKKRTT